MSQQDKKPAVSDRLTVFETASPAFPGHFYKDTLAQVDASHPLLQKLKDAKESGTPILLMASQWKEVQGWTFDAPDPAPVAVDKSIDEQRFEKMQEDLLERETWYDAANYDIGVTAIVKILVPLGGGTYHIGFEPLERVNVSGLHVSDFSQEAYISPRPLDLYDQNSSEVNALTELVRHEAVNLIKTLYPHQFSLSNEFVKNAGGQEFQGLRLANELAAITSSEDLVEALIGTMFSDHPERQILWVPEGHRQELLEQDTTYDRLMKLKEIVAFRHGMLKAENSLEGEVDRFHQLAAHKQEVDRQLGDLLDVIRRHNYHDVLNARLQQMPAQPGQKEEGGGNLAKLKAILKDKDLPSVMREEVDGILQKLTKSPDSFEAPKLEDYLKLVASLPWGAKDLGVLNASLANAQDALEKHHYGQKKVKEEILLNLAMQIRTGNPQGEIICLVGPPGVGKTGIAKGIAEATGRTFARIALGGVKDEAIMRGHSRTYVGSLPGVPVQALKTAGTTNPVILLDEIDKADEKIQAALLELLDPEQNNNFNDNYLRHGCDFSKVMFMVTANDPNTIHPALKDRMTIIDMPSYITREKLEIARNHLIPKTMKETGVPGMEWTDAAILEIIENYTWEAGVRNLSRAIKKICKTACRDYLRDKEASVANDDKITVTPDVVRQALGKVTERYHLSKKDDQVGLVTGLVVMGGIGGDLGFIQAAKLKKPESSPFEITATGSMKDVMKEAIEVVKIFVQSHSEKLGIDQKSLDQNKIHIHMPSGATPKDGPSAGMAKVVAVVSALSDTAVRKDVAMTGEVDIFGNSLPIGGLREKLTAAARAGIRKVFIPQENYDQDWDDIPDALKDNPDFQVIPVRTVFEVLEHALVKKPVPANDVKPSVAPVLNGAAGSAPHPAAM